MFAHVAYGGGSLLLYGGITKYQGNGKIFWGFIPTDNVLYSIAFATHTKTAVPTEMPFGMMSGLGLRNNVSREGDDQRGGIFGENM